ncbi:DUF3237 domain-containing protein [Loktanella sp. SALINAS62]|uniref:DUF3237 domain-containing protein n=1 Tax=Loktanella sp. SALINAS62 TaxID=2706124 RepID=UPI0020114A10|nr:DUF3237 domain-containing protein [Loktanella sp. SALINAS62]
MMQPPRPALTYAFTIQADIAPPRSAGPAPHGERLHIAIIGGQVRGPRLTGTIRPGGSDWPVIGPDGNSRIDARYTIEADDGTLIYVVNRGLRVSSAQTLQRLRAGEPVDPAEVYMRAAPVFDAPDGPHAWLRERLFVCSLSPRPEAIAIDVYLVE